jgi:hypothetical protein
MEGKDKKEFTNICSILNLTDRQIDFIKNMYFFEEDIQEAVEKFAVGLICNYIEPQEFLDKLMVDYPFAGQPPFEFDDSELEKEKE